MASFVCCARRRRPPPPLIVLTEPGGSSSVIEYAANGGGEAVNIGYVADNAEQENRRKSSFALADKIWDLEDQKDARQRIF